MRFQLAPDALLAGYRVEGHATVSSTNALALERAQAGDLGDLWVCALKQESGRGRRGRIWETPAGNLAATLLVVGSYEPKTAATFGFVAGLSLADALEAAAPDARIAVGVDGSDGEHDAHAARFRLKWPNDVLADGAKLSGILLESTVLTDGRFAVVVGIGVNVVAHPTDLPYPATSLHAMGSDISAEALFTALSAAWARNVAIWDHGRGLAAIRERWLRRAAGLGGEVTVRLDGAVLRGTFDTIDEDCRFVIRDAEGRLTRITAGEVHFGATASASAS